MNTSCGGSIEPEMGGYSHLLSMQLYPGLSAMAPTRSYNLWKHVKMWAQNARFTKSQPAKTNARQKQKSATFRYTMAAKIR